MDPCAGRSPSGPTGSAEECPLPKLIIDTDCGVDDAIALLAALNPRNADVVAVTCVAGNTSLENVCKNVSKVLAVCGRDDIPFYAGCDRPLARENIFGDHYHGSDGLGDCPEEYKAVNTPVSGVHAAQAMVDITKTRLGQIDLVLLGPCTNLAVAHHMDPQVTSYFRKIYLLGGNIEGRGNVTPGAEFNFACDPEAAHIVIQQSICPVVVVPWEIVTRTWIPWESYKQITSLPFKKSRFLKAICSFTEKYYQAEDVGHKGYELGDFLAVLAVCRPSSVLKKSELRVAVELRGEHTAGQLVQAWYKDMLPNVKKLTTVVTEMDIIIAEQILRDMMTD